MQTKLYETYQVIERIGVVAYKLGLPDLATIHIVFQVC
jgi:hypothetical protein